MTPSARPLPLVMLLLSRHFPPLWQLLLPLERQQLLYEHPQYGSLDRSNNGLQTTDTVDSDGTDNTSRIALLFPDKLSFLPQTMPEISDI